MIRKIYLLFIIIGVGFTNCDKIDHPIVEKYDDGLNWDLYPNGDSTTYDWPTWDKNTNTKRNVLIEDYTGHLCTNCPPAGAIAKQLEDDNPGRVFVASVHASPNGGFQGIYPNAPAEFTTDFTTEAGDIYCTEMDGFIGNPMGTINRTNDGYQPGLVWYLDGSWPTKTNELLGTNLQVNLQTKYNYYPNKNGLFVHTETEFLESLNGTYNLVVYLLRDSVISPQEFQGGITEEHYHHHSVLTDNINGTWGSQIVSGSAEAGEKIYNNFTYEIPTTDSTYNFGNLSLITYLCNRETYEILQVIKTNLQ